MKRRVVGIALFCLVLMAAIFAGYWDMLNTETTRIAMDGGPGAATGETSVEGATRATNSVPSPAASDPVAAPASAALAPTFDVLRVEPNGATVMAGRAAAGTTVRLTDGERVLGEEKAGPGGDFAIVLDRPLPVGEHQIRIETTGPDGSAATSRETAIVSVPEPGRESELLAMVETPDQPSRLISVPAATAVEAASKGASAVDSTPDATDAAPDASAPPKSSSDSAEPGRFAMPADPAAPAAPAAPASAASASNEATTPVGNAEGAAPASTRSSNLVAASPFAVEAVEIEDKTIYVAGRAPAGPTIRVYVDNVFLAEDAGRTSDRFLVSTTSVVAPGEHIVRADQVARDGAVIARVEVPFVKPAGRSMSAVSSAGQPSANDTAAGPSESAGSAPGMDLAAGTVETLPETEPEPNRGGAGAGTGAGTVVAPGTEPPAATPSEGSAPASGAPAAGDASTGAPTGGSAIAADRQAPLQAAGARVIIRRGDTLWRISRETYGRGARYTTIYLANGDQIRDPNRIYPGQVFRMPEGGPEASTE